MTRNMAQAIYKMMASGKEVSLLKGDEVLSKGKLSVDEENSAVEVGSEKVNYKSAISVGRDWLKVGDN